MTFLREVLDPLDQVADFDVTAVSRRLKSFLVRAAPRLARVATASALEARLATDLGRHGYAVTPPARDPTGRRV